MSSLGFTGLAMSVACARGDGGGAFTSSVTLTNSSCCVPTTARRSAPSQVQLGWMAVCARVDRARARTSFLKRARMVSMSSSSSSSSSTGRFLPFLDDLDDLPPPPLALLLAAAAAWTASHHRGGKAGGGHDQLRAPSSARRGPASRPDLGGRAALGGWGNPPVDSKGDGWGERGAVATSAGRCVPRRTFDLLQPLQAGLVGRLVRAQLGLLALPLGPALAHGGASAGRPAALTGGGGSAATPRALLVRRPRLSALGLGVAVGHSVPRGEAAAARSWCGSNWQHRQWPHGQCTRKVHPLSLARAMPETTDGLGPPDQSSPPTLGCALPTA